MNIVTFVKSAFLFALLVLTSGVNAASLSQEISEGDVKARFTVSTNEFSLAGVPIYLEIELESSSVCVATPPSDMTPYLDGFELESSFDDVVDTNGLIRCYYYKLIPLAGPKYSETERTIFPISISVLDSSFSPAKEKFILSKPFIFSVEKLNQEIIVSNNVAPKHIDYDHWITVEYTGYALLAIFLLYLIFRILRFIHRKLKLRNMSPRDRAYYELEILVSKELVASGFIKDFYIELTHIVRRYIERKYGIKAPERTTEEFITEAIELENFPKQYISKLKEFLVSADMIKFANVEATADTTNVAINAAKNYIKVDSLHILPKEKKTKKNKTKNNKSKRKGK